MYLSLLCTYNNLNFSAVTIWTSIYSFSVNVSKWHNDERYGFRHANKSPFLCRKHNKQSAVTASASWVEKFIHNNTFFWRIIHVRVFNSKVAIFIRDFHATINPSQIFLINNKLYFFQGSFNQCWMAINFIYIIHMHIEWLVIPFEKYIFLSHKMRDKLLLGHWDAHSYCLPRFRFFLVAVHFLNIVIDGKFMASRWYRESNRKRERKFLRILMWFFFIYVCLRKFNFFLINFLDIAPFLSISSLPPPYTPPFQRITLKNPRMLLLLVGEKWHDDENSRHITDGSWAKKKLL